MPNPATYADVAARWRPLSSEEQVLADTRLGDAWIMLKRRAEKRGVEDIDAALAADEDLKADTIRVLATAVIRVLKNPDGLDREKTDDYEYERSEGSPDGTLGFTDDELDELFPGIGDAGRAFSINMLGDYAARFE